jgi:hypothetical protein
MTKHFYSYRLIASLMLLFSTFTFSAMAQVTLTTSPGSLSPFTAMQEGNLLWNHLQLMEAICSVT